MSAPVVTVSEPDAFGTHRFVVDGAEVVTVQHTGGKLWRCDPAHRSEWRGVSERKVGEHLEGCGWVASSAEWHVYLTRALGTGRWYRSLPKALASGRQLAQGYTLCRKPVACRLCRLPKRHEGACVPWD
jgi:hypothetical protein